MAIPKKERFVLKDIRYQLEDLSPNPFPPERIKYNGMELILLGKSNKNDLDPVSIEDSGLHKAVLNEQIGQYTFVNKNGDIYEVELFVDETEVVTIYGIRTRLI